MNRLTVMRRALLFTGLAAILAVAPGCGGGKPGGAERSGTAPTASAQLRERVSRTQAQR